MKNNSENHNEKSTIFFRRCLKSKSSSQRMAKLDESVKVKWFVFIYSQLWTRSTHSREWSCCIIAQTYDLQFNDVSLCWQAFFWFFGINDNVANTIFRKDQLLEQEDIDNKVLKIAANSLLLIRHVSDSKRIQTYFKLYSINRDIELDAYIFLTTTSRNEIWEQMNAMSKLAIELSIS